LENAKGNDRQRCDDGQNHEHFDQRKSTRSSARDGVTTVYSSLQHDASDEVRERVLPQTEKTK